MAVAGNHVQVDGRDLVAQREVAGLAQQLSGADHEDATPLDRAQQLGHSRFVASQALQPQRDVGVQPAALTQGV